MYTRSATTPGAAAVTASEGDTVTEVELLAVVSKSVIHSTAGSQGLLDEAGQINSALRAQDARRLERIGRTSDRRVQSGRIQGVHYAVALRILDIYVERSPAAASRVVHRKNRVLNVAGRSWKRR